MYSKRTSMFKQLVKCACYLLNPKFLRANLWALNPKTKAYLSRAQHNPNARFEIKIKFKNLSLSLSRSQLHGNTASQTNKKELFSLIFACCMFVYSSICLFSVNFEILKCRSQCREHVIAEQTIWSAAFFRNRANEHSLSIEREIKRKETFYNIQVHKQTQRQKPTVTNFYTQNVRHAILSFSFSLGCSLLFHHLFCIALR